MNTVTNRLSKIILPSCVLIMAVITVAVITNHKTAYASVTDVYIAQTASGAADGTSCANAYAVSFFNTSGSWGAGSGQIGPGTIVHLCGTFTGTANSNMLTIQDSGVSDNPITIRFEEDAKLSAPYWNYGGNLATAGGAIKSNSKSYIVIDGGVNGVIENTDNGNGRTYQVASNAIHSTNGDNWEIKNLTIQNLFEPIGTGLNPASYGYGVIFYNSSNSSFHNNNVNYVGRGFYWASYSDSDVSVYDNTFNYVGQSINGGCGNDGQTANNFFVYNNIITNAVPWNYNDGVKAFCRGGTDDKFTNIKVYNNIIGPNIGATGAAATGHIVIDEGWIDTPFIYNNLILGGSSENISNGYITCGGRNTAIRVVNCRIINNTIYSNTTSSGEIGVYFSRQSTDHEVYNNIIAFPDYLSGNTLYPIWRNDSDVLINKSDYNVFYTPGILRFADPYSTYVSFATWKSNNTGFEDFSLLTNPNLDGAYKPTVSSNAYDAGCSTGCDGSNIATLFSADLENASRPQSAQWDIGAYEFIPTYTIGGTITGLTGTVVLRNNGGDNLSTASNGSFAFATPLNNSASYAVTVFTQPSGQTCVVSNGSGTVSSANVTNVSVACTTDDVTPSVRSAGSPSGAQATGTTGVTLTLTTDETATCKYGTTPSTAYGSIASTFATTAATSHSQNISGLTNGSSYNYYVRCIDTATNANTDDYTISFSVASASGGGGGSSRPTTPNPALPSTSLAFTNIKLVTEGSTYYVIKDNQRYGVTNPGILFSYGLEFSDGKPATQADNALPYTDNLKPGDGAFVKKPNDSTVYLIFDNSKHGFTSESVFNALGYSFSNVLEVTTNELDALPIGTVVADSNMAHPSGTFINQDGTIFRISQGMKFGIPSMEVYNSFNLDDDFSHVIKTNTQDRLLPVGSVLDKRTIQ